MRPGYDMFDDDLTSTPKPTGPCAKCREKTEWSTASTPYGRFWQCQRCRTLADAVNYEFDPRRVPSGHDESLAAIRVLQLLIIGLRHSQDGPLDPEDLYELLRPYFNAGWCVRDVMHALNQLPNGSPHLDSGWNDKLPRKQLLYRVQRRLREWRWVDRDKDDDIMAGGWSEMRRAMGIAALRQQSHAQAREDFWHRQADAARSSSASAARQAALTIASAAAVRRRRQRAAAEQTELHNTAKTAAEARAATNRMLERLDRFARGERWDDEDD